MARASLGKVSLRLDACVADPKREIFYPAGSLSSHRDSPSDSDEDNCHPAPGVLSPDSSAFRPTRENVIVFEVYSPCASPKDFPLSSGDSESAAFSCDNSDQTQVISTLQRTITQQRREIKTLRSQLSEREVSSDRRERSTMTLPLEELKSLPSVNQQVEQLTVTCRRHERRNQELHREIQACTSDLLELDKAKGKLASDLQKATDQAQQLAEELMKLSTFVSQLLPESDDDGCWAAPSDPKHLCNSVFSKVEILASRYSRLQAANDRLSEENAKLRQEVEARNRNLSSAQQCEIVKQLNTRIKLKDRFIQKLEKTLSTYKDKLVEMRDEDFRRSIDVDDLSFTRPTNLTENFSNRLRGIAEEAQSSLSREGSPSKANESPLPARSSPSPDLTKTPIKQHTEGDQVHVSGSENLNHTLDAPRKVDTPMIGTKLSTRSHQRTQSQDQLPPEKYYPVLQRRSIITRGRGDDKFKAITPIRVEKKTEPKTAKEGKSCSLDRRKQVETKPRWKPGTRIAK